jgi:hypothetical protein
VSAEDIVCMVRRSTTQVGPYVLETMIPFASLEHTANTINPQPIGRQRRTNHPTSVSVENRKNISQKLMDHDDDK